MTRQPGDADRLRRIGQILADPFGDNGDLTAKERRVAALGAEGLTEVEIARRIRSTEDNVENVLRSVARKTGIGKKRLPRYLISRVRAMLELTSGAEKT